MDSKRMEKYNRFCGKLLNDRYRIEKPVGMGGMAVVFKAMDTLTGRCVAIKMLREEEAANPQILRRFVNESRAVARLNHNNIVRIYDVSVDNPLKYIVMEYIDGMTLHDYMEYKKPLDWRDAVIYIDQILRALDHAHQNGVVHRDIKPQNIMLLEGGYVKVMDFGIAKLLDATDQTVKTSSAIGTVYYISPEQAQNTTIDCRSDIYSLGCMLYEMVTGKLPFTADNSVAVAVKQISEQPVAPSQINPRIPLGLEQIILCAMQKKPADRYQSASQMLRHIRQFENDPTIVFIMRRPAQKTPTSDVAIKRTETSSPDQRTPEQQAEQVRREPEARARVYDNLQHKAAPGENQQVRRAPSQQQQPQQRQQARTPAQSQQSRPSAQSQQSRPSAQRQGAPRPGQPQQNRQSQARPESDGGGRKKEKATIVFIFVIFLIIAAALLFLLYTLISRDVSMPKGESFMSEVFDKISLYARSLSL